MVWFHYYHYSTNEWTEARTALMWKSVLLVINWLKLLQTPQSLGPVIFAIWSEVWTHCHNGVWNTQRYFSQRFAHGESFCQERDQKSMRLLWTWAFTILPALAGWLATSHCMCTKSMTAALCDPQWSHRCAPGPPVPGTLSAHRQWGVLLPTWARCHRTGPRSLL